MKKFEEEFDKNVNTFDVVGQGECCKVHQAKKLCHGWVSPEDHQAEIAKRKQQYEEHQEIYFKTAKKLNETELELSKLKSQLEKQQPEIPEVPLFVGEWLDRKPLYAINGSIPVEIIEWSKKQTGYADLGMNINLLLELKVNGYTVAKEKRFYLKNKLTNDFLIKLGDSLKETAVFRLQEDPIEGQFTQQEIESMETGSYEQILIEEKQ